MKAPFLPTSCERSGVVLSTLLSYFSAALALAIPSKPVPSSTIVVSRASKGNRTKKANGPDRVQVLAIIEVSCEVALRTAQLLRTIPSDKANFRYAPDKWERERTVGPSH